MALFARLVGTEEPKLGVHQFMAALSELARGRMIRADIVTAFGLSASEDAELGAIIEKVGRVITPSDRLFSIHELEQVLILAEAGLRYTTDASAKTRLGL